MKKNLFKGIVLIILAAIILTGTGQILLIKSEDGISQLKSLYKQKENTIDVLFLGSSHVYCDIATGLLWDEYGISSFDLGGAEAPSWTSYYHLKEALKTQQPDVVFYEVSIASIRPTLYPPVFWVEDNIYGMKWNRNRIDALRINTYEDSFKDLLFPFSAMHGRYSELSKNDFADRNNSINYKGFDPREDVRSFRTPDVQNITAEEPCSEKAEEYLKKIIELCAQNDIELELFVSPYVINADEKKINNYMFSIGKQYGVECVDFNQYYDEMGMDFATDMAEELHLNYSGNEKFTRYFGNYIKDNYTIADHRGDTEYSSWDVDAKRQRIERSNLVIANCDDVKTLLETAFGDDYITVICAGINAKETLSTIDSAPYGTIVSGYTYICKGNELLHTLENTESKYVCDVNGDKYLIKKEPSSKDEGCDTSINMNKLHMVVDSGKTAIYVFDTINQTYVGSLSL